MDYGDLVITSFQLQQKSRVSSSKSRKSESHHDGTELQRASTTLSRDSLPKPRRYDFPKPKPPAPLKPNRLAKSVDDLDGGHSAPSSGVSRQMSPNKSQRQRNSMNNPENVIAEAQRNASRRLRSTSSFNVSDVSGGHGKDLALPEFSSRPAMPYSGGRYRFSSYDTGLEDETGRIDEHGQANFEDMRYYERSRRYDN